MCFVNVCLFFSLSLSLFPSLPPFPSLFPSLSLLAALALGIPDLSDLVTLIGAVASSALAMVFPPLIHMLVFWKDKDEKCCHFLPKPFWMVKDIAIILLGLIGFGVGTFASLNSVIHHFEKTEDEIAIYCASTFKSSCEV